MLGKKMFGQYRKQSSRQARALCAPAAGCMPKTIPSTRPLAWFDVAHHKLLRTSRGQQIVEYAILIAVISTALLFMYVYMKRGLQAVLKNRTDAMGSQADSEPAAGSVVITSDSVIDTLESSTRNTTVDGDARTYEFGSVSASSGNMTTLQEKY